MQSPDPVIRTAGVDDAELVGRLLHAFNAEFGDLTPDAATFGRRFAGLLAMPEVLVLLAGGGADGGDGADGFAFSTFRPTPYADGPVGLLDELWVHPDARGGGIGSALLLATMDEARRRGATELQIDVDESDAGARRFYERHGFSCIEPGATTRMLFYEREL